MEIDKIREERQIEGVRIWVKTGCNGTLFYATGVGKTYVGILAIKRIELHRKPLYLIAVPSFEIKKQWEDKLNAVFNKATMSRILVETVHTILTRETIYKDVVLIVDEAHDFATEERIKVLDGTLVKPLAVLCLTASADDKNYWKIIKYAPIVDTITEEEAREKGFIEEFVEYNLSLSLTAEEQEQYDKHSEIIKEYLPKFNNDLSLTNRCLAGGKDPKGTQYYSASSWCYAVAVKKGWSPDLNLAKEEHMLINDNWHPEKVVGYANRLMRAVRNRKDLLHSAKSKLLATTLLLDKFNEVKTIVFSEATSFADEVFEEVKNYHKAVIYHSNLKTIIEASPKTGKPIKIGALRRKRRAIEDIRNGTARVIITSKALDKGFDVVDLRMGITASGSQNPTQYKQRGGRLKRKEQNIFDDTTVLLVNLYIKGTQDEKWLSARQKNSTHKIIAISSLEEIDFKPKSNGEFIVNK